MAGFRRGLPVLWMAVDALSPAAFVRIFSRLLSASALPGWKLTPVHLKGDAPAGLFLRTSLESDRDVPGLSSWLAVTVPLEVLR